MDTESGLDTGDADQVAAPRRIRRAEDPGPSWWPHIGPTGAAKILILAALMTWLYWGHFYRLYRWWLQPDWSHGFLIPIFSLYIVHTKRRELLSRRNEGSILGLVLMILSIVIYVESVRRKIGYPQPLSMVLMIVGLVLLLAGWRTLRLTLFPISFMVLAIPPPKYLYRAVTQPLQQCIAAASKVILNAFPGASVDPERGINISYFMDSGHSGTFTVAGACSGMRSLMAFVALGLAMAYFTRRSAWQRIAIVLVVVPVALFCNTLRVVITGGLHMYGHEDLAGGTLHALLGFALFGFGFMIYLGILWVMDHLFIEVSEDDSGAPEQTAGGNA